MSVNATTTSTTTTTSPGFFNEVWAPGAVVGLVAVMLIAATAMAYGAYTWIYKRCRHRRQQHHHHAANYEMQLDDNNDEHDAHAFEDAMTALPPPTLDDIVAHDSTENKNALDF